MAYLSKTIRNLQFRDSCVSLPHLPINSPSKRYISTKPDPSPISRTRLPSNLQCPVKDPNTLYIDLKRSRLYVRAKIVKADGTNLTDKEKTGIINLPLHTIVIASGCLHEQ